MMRFFVELDRRIGWILNASVIISSITLVGLMLFLVVARYVFGWSVIGLLEMIMVFGMWLYMIGALIASRKREHLVVDFLHEQIASRRLRLLHRVVVAAVTFVICIFFGYLAYRMLQWGMRRPQHTPGLSLPLWWPQSAIMFASIGCSLYALRDLVLSIIHLVRNKPELSGVQADPLALVDSHQAKVGVEC